MKVCLVFLDLNKAFDTVKKDILIQKLESHGLTGQCAKVFESYLSERNQFVQNGRNISKTPKTRVGAPQGSVLRALYFLIYFIDLLSHLSNENFSLILFGDDISLTSPQKLFQ